MKVGGCSQAQRGILIKMLHGLLLYSLVSCFELPSSDGRLFSLPGSPPAQGVTL